MPGTRKLGKTTDQRMAMLRQQVTDLLGTGDGSLHLAVVQEIGDLLTQHSHTLISGLAKLTSSGHFGFLLNRILVSRKIRHGIN